MGVVWAEQVFVVRPNATFKARPAQLTRVLSGPMHMKTAVVALGGNALARSGEPATITNQFRHTRSSLAPIVELAREGWAIALVHGNGPQVGDELTRNELS